MQLGKNLTILGVLAAVASFGCGSKSHDPVIDPGPAFRLESSSGTLEAKEANIMELHRDEPSFGPQIQIQTVQKSNITQSEKKIICPPSKPILGKTIRAPDVNIFNFRIAEVDFPGLVSLPLNADCTLQVVLTNNVGSTLNVGVPLSVKFDKPNAVPVVVSIAVVPYLQLFDDQEEFIIEKYEIHNPFDYAIGFFYHPQRSILGYPVHLTNCGPEQGGYPCTSRYVYINEVAIVPPKRLALSSNAVFEGGDYKTEMKFRVKPQDTVTISCFGQFMKSYKTHPLHSLVGIHVKTTPFPSPSLTMWRGFELSQVDLSSPLGAPISDSLAVPGYRPLLFNPGEIDAM